MERTRDNFDLLEAVMSNMTEGLYTVDAQGAVTSMNRAAERMFGWSFNELRGKKMHAMTHHSRRDGSPFPAEECAGLQVLLKGTPLTDFEDVFVRKDGSFFDVQYSSSPIREDDRITGLVVVFQDISGRKKAEEARLRLAAIVESSDDAIISKDLNSIITTWNRGATRIFGYIPAEIVGKSVLTLFPPDRFDEEAAILARMRSGERIEHFETVRVRKDGRQIHVSLTLSPIKDANNRIIGISKIARDISERAHAEETMRALSTPVLQVRERLLILPIIGIIDPRRATQLTEQLLRSIRTHRAKAVVMDVTGVPAMDGAVANHLVRTIESARLLGATIIMTGVSGEIAQTLVTIGVDLTKLNTLGDLQGGIEEAERLLQAMPEDGDRPIRVA